MSIRIKLLASVGALFLIRTALGAEVETVPATDKPPAEESEKDSMSFASDGDRLDGDHLKLKVNVDGFEAVGSTAGKKYCAPKGAKIKVTRQTDSDVLVVFKQVPQSSDAREKNSVASTGEAATRAAVEACGANLVNDYTQYKLSTTKLRDHAFRRTGVMFGALVVPFKFYLGDDSKLSASSTIAPYIGFRGPAPFNLTFTPVISAGLGLVPVADAAAGETSTKSALSTAFGVLLTHTKNEKFNAGILFGKDFLSKGDRAGDKSVDNLWFSIYAGYAL
jgi:hypothetical protein